MKEGLDGGKSCGKNRMGEESERGGCLWLVVWGGIGGEGGIINYVEEDWEELGWVGGCSLSLYLHP